MMHGTHTVKCIAIFAKDERVEYDSVHLPTYQRRKQQILNREPQRNTL